MRMFWCVWCVAIVVLVIELVVWGVETMLWLCIGLWCPCIVGEGSSDIGFVCRGWFCVCCCWCCRQRCYSLADGCWCLFAMKVERWLGKCGISIIFKCMRFHWALITAGKYHHYHIGTTCVGCDEMWSWLFEACCRRCWYVIWIP